MSYNVDKSYKDISSSVALSLLDYNEKTGIFKWRFREEGPKSWNTQNAGKESGRLINGYRYIRINGRSYRAHRLAWLMVTGEWPDHEIDHINGNRDDNRFHNLRLADRVQQGHNRHASGKSNILGVHWCKKNNKWFAFTRIDGKKKNLGGFNCPAAASIAYQIAVHKKVGNYTRMNAVAL